MPKKEAQKKPKLPKYWSTPNGANGEPAGLSDRDYVVGTRRFTPWTGQPNTAAQQSMNRNRSVPAAAPASVFRPVPVAPTYQAPTVVRAPVVAPPAPTFVMTPRASVPPPAVVAPAMPVPTYAQPTVARVAIPQIMPPAMSLPPAMSVPHAVKPPPASARGVAPAMPQPIAPTGQSTRVAGLGNSMAYRQRTSPCGC